LPILVEILDESRIAAHENAPGRRDNDNVRLLLTPRHADISDGGRRPAYLAHSSTCDKAVVIGDGDKV
jgi:hypothetical protein